MADHSQPAIALATKAVELELEYQPGVCNIGPEEIAMRRRAGHASAAVTLGLLIVILVTRAPRAARLLIAMPAAGAASGYLQARHRFCAGYGSRGVFNLGRVGDTTAVADPSARAADLATSRRIGLQSGLVGLAAGIAAVALPARSARD